MKTRKWLLIGLLLVFATGACWQAFAEELSAPDKPWGREYAGGRAMGPGEAPPMFGLAGRDPELAGLVQDIFTLRQINRADLSVKQIEGVLPVLRTLAGEKESLVSETREALLKERERLLRQQGPDEEKKVARPPLMRERLESHREKVERARAQLREVLSAPQAEILAEMIGPPGGFRHRHRWGNGEAGRGGRGGGGGGRHMEGTERRGPGAGHGGEMGPGREMRSGRGDGKGRDRMGGRGGGRGTGMGRAHPAVDIDRLIDLLEEKHAAMRK